MELDLNEIKALQDETRHFYTKIVSLTNDYERFSQRKSSLIKALRTAEALHRLSLLPDFLGTLLVDSPEEGEIHIKESRSQMAPIRNIAQVKMYARILRMHFSSADDQYHQWNVIKDFLKIWNQFKELRMYVSSRIWTSKYSRMSDHPEAAKTLVRDINRYLTKWEQLQYNEYDFSSLIKEPTVTLFRFGSDHRFALKYDELTLYGGLILVIPKAIYLAFTLHDLIKEYCFSLVKMTETYVLRERLRDTLEKRQPELNRNFARRAKLSEFSSSNENLYSLSTPKHVTRSLPLIPAPSPDTVSSRDTIPKRTKKNHIDLYGRPRNNFPGDPMEALRRMGASYDRKARRFYASRR